MTTEEIKKNYADCEGYIWCEDCPLLKNGNCSLNLTTICDGKDVAYEAIQKHCSSNDSTNNAVNHPGHYNQGKYECIEVMAETFGIEATKHFCLLNAFKYIWRTGEKNGEEDIKKAIWYLNKHLELEGGNDSD